ncbi:hypothetical protein ACCO45_003144 [Purpureocillium lilacinum]|uniref:Uncharacterized protein n=1 Tax=Purpureocillium lilacinum TaxID=33203 RepID=A0ACC4DZ36_PURLI
MQVVSSRRRTERTLAVRPLLAGPLPSASDCVLEGGYDFMGCPVCTASSQVGAPDCQQVLLAGAIGRGTCSHQKVAPTAPVDQAWKSGQRPRGSGYSEAVQLQMLGDLGSRREVPSTSGSSLSRSPSSRVQAEVVVAAPPPPTPALQAHLAV